MLLKLKNFLNSLSQAEVRELWLFLRSKKWQEWLYIIKSGGKIQ